MLMAAMKSPGKSGFDPTWPSTSTVFQNRRAPPTLGVKLPNWPPFEAVPAGSLAGISPHGDMAMLPTPGRTRKRAITSRPAIGILASCTWFREGAVSEPSVLMAGAWAEMVTDSVDCPTVNRRFAEAEPVAAGEHDARLPERLKPRGFDGYGVSGRPQCGENELARFLGGCLARILRRLVGQRDLGRRAPRLPTGLLQCRRWCPKSFAASPRSSEIRPGYRK